MAYIGQSIKNGTFTDLGFTGTFNSSTTDFNLGTQVGSAAQILVSKNGVVQRPGTDFTLASGGSQISFTTAPASGDSIFIVEISGAIGGPMNRDINGEELILDVDGDTSIQADTDDQIDVKIGGTAQFSIKDGVVEPTTDNDVDIGSTSKEFKDGYFDGTLHCDVLDLAGTEFTSVGKIAQVVTTVLTSTTSSSSTSYVDVGMNISITPSATSSKVLLMFFPRLGHDTGSANIFMKIRNNTAGSDVTADPFIVRRWPSDGQSAYYTAPSPIVVLDSPSTSSAVEYRMQFKTNGGGFRINQPANNGGYSDTEVSTIIAMEVLA